MSASDLSSSFNSADLEDSPLPPSEPWKHLEHPDADEWLRGPRDEREFPNVGDFVVLSIDPLATVSHLDATAKRTAQRVPVRRYIALAMQSYGLPMHTKVTHPYDFMFVRKGRPEPRLPECDSQDSCIAILPNDVQVDSRSLVQPAQPLPWDNCYLDATYGFPQSCRVTSTVRDYIPVLPLPNAEVIRLRRWLRPHGFNLQNLRREKGANWPEPFNLISLPSLPSLKDSLVPNPLLLPVPTQEGTIGEDTRLDRGSADDDVSMLASEDGAQSEDSQSQS